MTSMETRDFLSLKLRDPVSDCTARRSTHPTRVTKKETRSPGTSRPCVGVQVNTCTRVEVHTSTVRSRGPKGHFGRRSK